MKLRAGEVRIIGIGNILYQDEGVGVQVVRLLEGTPVANQACLIDGGSAGLTLLEFLEGASRAIVVDTADMGLEAGAWRRFSPDEVISTKQLPNHSLHEADLLQVFALGQALGRPLPPTVFYGIQPQIVDFGQELTPPVAAAARAVAAAIQRELAAA